MMVVMMTTDSARHSVATALLLQLVLLASAAAAPVVIPAAAVMRRRRDAAPEAQALMATKQLLSLVLRCTLRLRQGTELTACAPTQAAAVRAALRVRQSLVHTAAARGWARQALSWQAMQRGDSSPLVLVPVLAVESRFPSLSLASRCSRRRWRRS